MKASRVLVAAFAAALIAGCSRPAADSQPTSMATNGAATSPASDDVVPVSLTSAKGLAADGLEGCGVSMYADQIRGIGVLERSTMLPRYVPLTGREPEIKPDRPAFAVLFEGSIRLPFRGGQGSATYADIESATCVFIDGAPIWYVTGPWEDSLGNKGTPEPAPLMDRDLPPALP